jgi:hypothetical protein
MMMLSHPVDQLCRLVVDAGGSVGQIPQKRE